MTKRRVSRETVNKTVSLHPVTDEGLLIWIDEVTNRLDARGRPLVTTADLLRQALYRMHLEEVPGAVIPPHMNPDQLSGLVAQLIQEVRTLQRQVAELQSRPLVVAAGVPATTEGEGYEVPEEMLNNILASLGAQFEE